MKTRFSGVQRGSVTNPEFIQFSKIDEELYGLELTFIENNLKIVYLGKNSSGSLSIGFEKNTDNRERELKFTIDFLDEEFKGNIVLEDIKYEGPVIYIQFSVYDNQRILEEINTNGWKK